MKTLSPPADLHAMAADPAAFRAGLVVPLAHGPGRFGEALADFQAADFRGLDAAFLALRSGARPPVGKAWLERTKGCSKDTDLAVMVLWLLAFAARPLSCQVGAADQSQADELRKAAAVIVRLNPWLGEAVEVRADALLNPRTGSRCDVLSTDAPGSHGARPDLLILNELTHLPGDRGREFAETLMDNASKVPAGLVVVATNAGFVPSWQWDWREQARQSRRWYVSAVSEPAPWLDPAEVAEAQRRNPPSRFNRLWRGVWSAGGGDALDETDLSAAVTLPGPPDETAEPGWRFAAGLDLGLTHDASALVIVGKHVGHTEVRELAAPAPAGPFGALADLGLVEVPDRTPIEVTDYPGTGRVRLAAVRVWRPPAGGRVDLAAVEESAAAAATRFDLDCLAFDPWQAHHMGQRLAARGIPTMPVDPTPGNLRQMAAEVLDGFRERRIDLFADPDLARDLAALRLVERSYGVRLESPRDGRGHGDSASAFALSLFAARLLRRQGGAVATGPLVWH